MTMANKKTYIRVAGATLVVATLGYALANEATSISATPTASDQQVEAVEVAETRGVEMSQTSSVVQSGVKRGSQLSLEKALDLIARPRSSPGGGGSKSAAGIGGGGGRPVGGGGGDGNARNRMKGAMREMMNTGS